MFVIRRRRPGTRSVKPRPGVSHLLDNPGAVISGTIIHDHGLEVLKRLRQDGTDRYHEVVCHELTIKATGLKNDAWTATSIVVDAFDVTP